MYGFQGLIDIRLRSCLSASENSLLWTNFNLQNHKMLLYSKNEREKVHEKISYKLLTLQSRQILLIKDQKSNKCSICRLPVQSYLAAQLTSNLSVTELQQNSLAASISQTYLAITTIITPSNTIILCRDWLCIKYSTNQTQA